MKQAVKSALGLGTAATTHGNSYGTTGVSPYGVTNGMSSYGPTYGTIPVTQTITVPTMVDTVETIQQPVMSQSTTTTIQKQVIAPVIEHREVAPVIHQRFRQEEVEEMQPIIHREREKTEIHKILQPMYTTSTMNVASEERTLAAQVRPEIRFQGPPAPATLIPTTEYESAQRVRVDKAPIVMETERKRVIEEVQPVVYKEIIQPHIIRLTQPIYEKIIEADVYVERVLPATTFVTPVTTTFSAPIVTQSISSTSMNIAEPTSAFTQTFEIPNAPQSSSRIEGVSQGVQVAPVGFSVQSLGNQSSLGIQQPVSSFYSTLPSQSFVGSQSNLLGSQGGLAQPGFGSMGNQQSNLGYQQNNLGMQQGQPGFAQNNLGYQQSNLGYQQSNLEMQQGQQGFAQNNSGYQQSGLGQQGFAPSNLGMQQGQQGFAQNNLGYQQSGLGQGLQQGLAQGSLGAPQSSFGNQGLASGMGQQLGGVLGKGLSSTLGTATAF